MGRISIGVPSPVPKGEGPGAPSALFGKIVKIGGSRPGQAVYVELLEISALWMSRAA
jgi:hypothetical protein